MTMCDAEAPQPSPRPPLVPHKLRLPGRMLTDTPRQVLPHTSLPDHEEEQPVDTHHAAGGPGHAPQGLRQIRSVAPLHGRGQVYLHPRQLLGRRRANH